MNGVPHHQDSMRLWYSDWQWTYFLLRYVRIFHISQEAYTLYTSSNLSSDTQVAIRSLMMADGLTYEEAFRFYYEF